VVISILLSTSRRTRGKLKYRCPRSSRRFRINLQRKNGLMSRNSTKGAAPILKYPQQRVTFPICRWKKRKAEPLLDKLVRPPLLPVERKVIRVDHSEEADKEETKRKLIMIKIQ
jgi:hypothetical protein